MNPGYSIGQSIQREIRSVQGFSVYVLRNDCVELALVPALGARIISLRDVRTGREWLWHPPAGLKLFANHPDDDFSISPLAGVDECLPTIDRCVWHDRHLPDHGEVWAVPWQLDEAAWTAGKLVTRVRLGISPFEFERTLAINENEVILNYQLENLAGVEEHFLWALHPLIRVKEGDHLELPESTLRRFSAGNWKQPLASMVPINHSLKAFARPLAEGRVVIRNGDIRDRLEFSWETDHNDTLGLWLTRGGWHGHHHFAIEPTNAAGDSLAAVVAQNQGRSVPPHGRATWSVSLRVGI